MREICRRKVLGVAVFLVAVFSHHGENVVAQEQPTQTCNISPDIRGFSLVAGQAFDLAATFANKSTSLSKANQVRTEVVYRYLLGRIASKETALSSGNQCTFIYRIDTNLWLHFELAPINRSHDQCSFYTCAQQLSNATSVVEVTQKRFSETVRDLVQTFRRHEAVDLRYPHLSVQRAVTEVFRKIYPKDSRPQILADINPSDFEAVNFTSFLDWFEERRRLLSEPSVGAEGKNIEDAPRSGGLISDDKCQKPSEIPIEHLTISASGWGQRSIIMIKNGFDGGRPFLIRNSALREICRPEEIGNIPSSETWRTMASRLGCERRQTSQDRWLTLFPKKEPAISLKDADSYASAIASAISADQCVPADIRLLVVSFSTGEN